MYVTIWGIWSFCMDIQSTRNSELYGRLMQLYWDFFWLQTARLSRFSQCDKMGIYKHSLLSIKFYSNMIHPRRIMQIQPTILANCKNAILFAIRLQIMTWVKLTSYEGRAVSCTLIMKWHCALEKSLETSIGSSENQLTIAACWIEAEPKTSSPVQICGENMFCGAESIQNLAVKSVCLSSICKEI